MRFKALLTLLVVFVSIQVNAQKMVLHCGGVLDMKSDKLQKEMSIVVEDGIISSIQKGYIEVSSSDQLVDLRDKTVLPGLMDMHVHIESETSPNRYIKEFTSNEADIAFDAANYAETTLMAGFTTVRDLGGSGVNIALRNAINAGKTVGPRIYTAGKAIATTGGHADPSNSYRADLVGDPGPKEGVINGPYEARKAVRQRYKNGADVIKITATGGVLSVAKDGSGPQFQMDELEAIVQTAKEYGMITAAHAHGAEGMKRAVKAGITSIEHGTLMTTEVMDLMIEMGTYYVPTITAGKFVAEKAKIDGYYPALVVPKALEIGPKIQNTFKQAYERGVKIAFGTDAAVFPHGENGKEFGYMVEVGMKPIEALRSATVTNAEMLGVSDKFGTLEKGKMADIIAVNDNPLENIGTMEEVSFVMKGGTVYKSPN